ncbi:MAG TPA: ABC transporter permease [Actinomycetota bacterium]|nr:ABC transporter permease [Actinomycetota bacterium]
MSSASARWSDVAGSSATWSNVAKQILPRLAAVGGLLLIWWLISISGLFSESVVPAPDSVIASFAENFAQPSPPRESILDAAQASVIRLIVGLGIGILIGTALGLTMAASAWIQRSVGSLMSGLQALPSISWLPLAIIWFGLNERAILFVVVIASIPAVAIAAASAIRLVPPLLVRAGRTLGARRWTLYRRVVLPAAVPAYLGGLQSAWALAWRALMAGELISTGGKGLGHLLDANRQIFSTRNIFAVMLMIIIVGMSVEALFGAVDRRVRSRRGLLVNA